MLFSDDNKSVRKTVFLLFGLLVIIINFCVFSANAQSKKTDKVAFDNCETITARLWNVAYDFHKNAKPDSYLVIIGGAMKGEKSLYNSRRIQQSIKFFDFEKAMKSERIVFGIGTSEAEAGYLKLYVNGILSSEIRTRKSAKLCWSEGDEIELSENQ